MNRVINFSAGPSALPLEVLEAAQKETVCYKDSGMSVMEMSHRSKVYEEIIGETEKDLRALMNIPDNYKVLFLQGGASLQFAMIPLNLSKKGSADYVNTGLWSKKAIAEAKKLGKVNVVASSEDTTFNYIPKLDSNKFDDSADYFHITLNNTIYGTRFTKSKIPDTKNVPLVTDASSIILSEDIDVKKFGLIYAGAQKNMAPAGVVAVIIREDLLDIAKDDILSMMSYKIHADNDSMFNTPPTYSIYVMGLVFKWLLKMGGVPAIQKRNEEKGKVIYDFLDNSKLFKATVAAEDRSLMNVPFVTGNPDLDAKFVKESSNNGFLNLKGHRSVGGMRASMYNAIDVGQVTALVDFMKKFEKENV